MKMSFQALGFLLSTLAIIAHSQAALLQYTFVVQETNYTRLCTSKNILTVNGEFPGPTITARRGDTVIVDVINGGDHNITIHWHGIKQPRYPWSDGPEFVTQCPIQPGANFSQQVLLSDEEGTLWWHAHSDWSRATIHGLFVILPRLGTTYPFTQPDGEVPVVLGKTYLLRMVNAAMNNLAFFAVANHTLTVVGTDGAYTKPFRSNVITISPGQTIDLLLQANQPRDNYYMAAKLFSGQSSAAFDNTTTTAIVQYTGNFTPSSSSPVFPFLPVFDDRNASANFTGSLRSLASAEHPIDVPLTIKRTLLYTLSINTLPCAVNATCEGPNGRRLSASINNITFAMPTTSVLGAYYRGINGVYGDDFPDVPPLKFNYTATGLNRSLQTPDIRTEVTMLKHNETVELVFQGTNLVAGIDHPMHLHGHSFYVVGSGFGNFKRSRDSLNYNLVDPPLMQTIAVAQNGWTAIRFKADNPVRNGKSANARVLPPPPDMPPC
ncbi:Cupredoxin [Cynara cardunculus var. scolymus]|uniref:Cupredoxin n=1 Tax=Cynara cardunculus var. scolymus TaxID=59895 RepID=A0A103YDS0_CYNCS|nr:Cupredoxin [Cynara cardunculus var. scolymus]